VGIIGAFTANGITMLNQESMVLSSVPKRLSVSK